MLQQPLPIHDNETPVGREPDPLPAHLDELRSLEPPKCWTEPPAEPPDRLIEFLRKVDPFVRQATSRAQTAPRDEAVLCLVQRHDQADEQPEFRVGQNDFGPVDPDDVTLSSLRLAGDLDDQRALEPMLLKFVLFGLR